MNNEKENPTFQVQIQYWEESERGWGVRDDGYSVHLTEEDYQEYLKEFIEEEKKRNSKNPYGYVPEIYVRPSLNKTKSVLVTEKIYKKLKLLKACAEYGMRIWSKDEFSEIK